MSIRQTRREYGMGVGRGPKITAAEFIAKVRRLMARRMVADGVVERKGDGPKFSWNFWATLPPTYQSLTNPLLRNNEVHGRVGANTKGEARAAIKILLSVKRLPPGIIIEKDNADSTPSVGAA